nr:NYN domain-containing protein [Acinetobacter bereziniae]
MGLIIDAMDLLYSNALDGFCMIVSESDFSSLASKELGKVVWLFVGSAKSKYLKLSERTVINSFMLDT